ncbi:hypothetical protein Cni_G20767 [Canna indica]|uniref:Uncharacterized protein n=1 Tax=Canna indica TaxID=4628 RepID=A0AAQ3KN80_9LILI|nr:hypothetical protein Cni_G20767 [Canna indica]
MRLRQLQRSGRTFFRDSGLLQVLRSEINHELSSSTISSTGNEVGNMVEGFVLEWDNPWTQDVVLRRRPDHAFSDEIAVSSLLAPLRFQDEDPLPRNALMKVCIRKTGYDPILHFDCCVFRRNVSQSPWATREATNEGAGTDFTIKRSYFHYPSSPLALSKHNPTRAFVRCVLTTLYILHHFIL